MVSPSAFAVLLLMTSSNRVALSQRQLTRPGALQDLCDLLGRDRIDLGLRRTVGHQPARSAWYVPRSFYLEASTIGPVGASTPAAGSSVTAKTFTGCPGGGAGTVSVARPVASGAKTPAARGAAPAIVHSS